MRGARCLVGLLLVFLVVELAVGDDVQPGPAANESLGKAERVEKKDAEAKEEVRVQEQKAGAVGQASLNKTGDITSKHTVESSAAAAAATTTQPTVQHTIEMENSPLNTGALKRAVIVTFGLCGLAMMYIVFRSLRVNKSRPQMVRKYGILAHRQDVEMRPLPLDEDDEDDTTVFDASNISAQRLET